jgi:hypothetical protein
MGLEAKIVVSASNSNAAPAQTIVEGLQIKGKVIHVFHRKGS